MPTYKYTEPDTGIVYTMIVENQDVATINALRSGMSVTLASGHRLDVDANGGVMITNKDGKKSTANLAALQNGQIP